MRKTIIAAAALAAFLVPAAAADLVTKSQPVVYQSAPTWAGFYVGAQAAYGRSVDNVSIMGTNTIGAAVVGTGAIPGSLEPNADGWLAGLHAGYNWQVGVIVYGVEAAFDFSGVDGSASHVLSAAPLGLPVSLTTTATTELDWLATVTARVGTVIGDRLLVFGRGGLAYGNVGFSVTNTLSAPAPFGRTIGGSVSDTRFGWTVGAGAEYAITRNMTARVTYDYVDLGSETVTYGTSFGPGAPVNFSANADFTFHKVGGGVSWRF